MPCGPCDSPVALLQGDQFDQMDSHTRYPVCYKTGLTVHLMHLSIVGPETSYVRIKLCSPINMLTTRMLQATGRSYSLVGSPVVLCKNAVLLETGCIISIQVEWSVKKHVSHCTEDIL